MKKKLLTLMAAAALTAALTGCASGSSSSGVSSTAAEQIPSTETTTVSDSSETTASMESSGSETVSTPDPSGSEQLQQNITTVRVGSLKGPTSMGLVWLMDQAGQEKALGSYEFTMVTAADELLAKIVKNELDIALIPANVSSLLYHKTNGNISVININTLGVLDIVSADDTVKSIQDLKGRTVYLTGKGTTPDYVMNYLLTANGLNPGDVTLEYKSEATEVAALLAEQPDAVGMLPQPFVTAACAQNDALKIVLDCTKEWEKVQGESGSQLVTGVTIVRNEFLNDHPETVDLFLTEHQTSAEYVTTDLDGAAELIAGVGIIEKAPVAKKALPYCNITALTGNEMKAALSGYLQVLFEQDPASIGGSLPEDNFYYLP